MAKILNIAIDEDYGQILLPIEVCKNLNLKNFDWLRVNIKSDQIVLSLPNDEVDEDLLEALIHEGVLIDCR